MSQASSKIYLWMMETSLLLVENIFIGNPVVSKVSRFAHIGLQTTNKQTTNQRCAKDSKDVPIEAIPKVSEEAPNVVKDVPNISKGVSGVSKDIRNSS